MTTISSIGTDILHQFLLHSHNRADLAAFVQSGHVVYDVFKEHPNSILRNVVGNEVGIVEDVFPYCWETLRLLNHEQLPNVSRLGRPRIIVEQEFTTSVRREHVSLLREIQKQVNQLQRMYSVHFKDGVQRYDTLTGTESYRFQIALHLFWQYQSMWQAFQSPLRDMIDHDDDEDDDEDDEYDEDDDISGDALGGQNAQSASGSGHASPAKPNPSTVDQDTIERCNAFLDAQPTPHLLWLQEFRTFLLNQIDWELDTKNRPNIFAEIRVWGLNPDYGSKLSLDQWRNHLLSTSLFMIYNPTYALSLVNLVPTELSTSGLWLADSLSAAIRRKASETGHGCSTGRILIYKGVLVTQCQKCEKVPNFHSQLVNITNAKERRSLVRPDMLPQYLSYNPVEIERLRNRIFGPYSPEQIWWQTSPEIHDAQETVMEEILTHGAIAAMSSLASTDVTANRAKSLELSDDEDEDGDDTQKSKISKDSDDNVTSDGTRATSNTGTTSSGLQPSQKQGASVAYRWSPLDVLCDACFHTEFQRMSYAWWLEERETDRVQPHNVTENCWWGIECTTQRRQPHAIKLNHCCPRIK